MELKKKRGEIVEVPKRGRPTDAVKEHDLKVRVTDELHQRIVDYSNQHNQTKAETTRQALNAFLPEVGKDKYKTALLTDQSEKGLFILQQGLKPV